jgi:hypothetical protein
MATNTQTDSLEAQLRGLGNLLLSTDNSLTIYEKIMAPARDFWIQPSLTLSKSTMRDFFEHSHVIMKDPQFFMCYYGALPVAATLANHGRNFTPFSMAGRMTYRVVEKFCSNNGLFNTHPTLRKNLVLF